MDIKKILYNLSDYYLINRSVSYTNFLKKCLKYHKEKNIKILTARLSNDVLLSSKDKNHVSLNTLERLRGSNEPLIIDDDALIEIFKFSIDRINELEDKNSELSVEVHRLTIILREIKKISNTL